MEQFLTNKIFLENKNKFSIIKNNFIQLSNISSKTQLKKYKTISIFLNRPNLKRIKKLYNEKHNIKNQLDQIGKEDSIFNNDKLITNIKLETLEDLTVNDIFEETMKKEIGNNTNKNNLKNKQYQSPNKTSKRCLTSLTKTTGKRNKRNIYKKKEETKKNEVTLELNCNKMSLNNASLTKTNNQKYSKKKVITKPNQKNLNLFINKPKNTNIKNNININQINDILMAPIATKNKRSRKINSNISFTKLNNSCENTNESVCLTSISKITTKTYNKGNSLSVKKKQSKMHFPNKSNIKNKDKLLSELQKLFSEQIQLNDDTYQNMTDLDKKNCIIFLLDAIKEMFNINKIAQSKNEDFKEINKAKEKKIQDDKNEIKELKKDIIKLNKIIKTNILINRKLSQKVDNLKILLEKEKNKNKNQIGVSKRGITTENKQSNKKNKLRYRNKINGFITPDSKKKFMNKSVDILKNNNIIIDENNYQCNKDNKLNDNLSNKDMKNSISKEVNNDIQKNLENNLNNCLLLNKNFTKEKKGIGNNSDCTNFSDVNNGLIE